MHFGVDGHPTTLQRLKPSCTSLAVIKSAYSFAGDFLAQVFGTTLSQYLRAVRIFLAFVAQCAGSLALLSLAHQASVQEDRFALKCSPLLMCKALSWLAHIGQIRGLADLMVNPLVRALSSTPAPHDRREALPLPLAILAAWESHIVSRLCPPAVGLVLGAFLLCAHCSLRFANALGPSPFHFRHKHLEGFVGRPKPQIRASLLLGQALEATKTESKKHSSRISFCMPDLASLPFHALCPTCKHWYAFAGPYNCPGCQKADS